MRRDLCASCMSSDLQLALDLGTAPLADEFPTAPALDQARYPLQLLVCQACGLAQLGEVVDDKQLWGGDYAFYCGSSATIRDYYHRYAGWLVDRYRLLMASGMLVEVACNDGTLLGKIRDLNVAPLLVGIDPAAGPAAVAGDRGLQVHVAAFGQAAAEKLIDDYGRRAKVIVANNVAAHVVDPVDFFAGIRLLLHPDGVAIVEVQYLPDLLLGNDYPLLYHEHRSYYSLASLVRTVGRCGLTVTEAWLTEPQGGSLRVELRPDTNEYQDVGQGVSRILTAERWLHGPGAYAGLQGRAERLRTRLLELLFDEALAGRTVAGYGASAKASTLLAWLGQTAPPTEMPAHVVGSRRRNSELISWFVDTTPSKIGRYMPGTAIPVVARTEGPDHPDGPDTYLLCIWNYLGHVLRQEASWLGRSSAGPPGKTPHRMILPVPVPKLI